MSKSGHRAAKSGHADGTSADGVALVTTTDVESGGQSRQLKTTAVDGAANVVKVC